MGVYWHYVGCVFINIAAFEVRRAALMYRCREGLSQHKRRDVVLCHARNPENRLRGETKMDQCVFFTQHCRIKGDKCAAAQRAGIDATAAAQKRRRYHCVPVPRLKLPYRAGEKTKPKTATLHRDSSVTGGGIESRVPWRSPTTAARPPQWPRNLPRERRVAGTGGGGRARWR